MALAATQSRNPVRTPQERRRHQRVRVNLLGRYMLADRREYPLPGRQHVARRHGADRAGHAARSANASSPMSIISAGWKARSPAMLAERLRHDDLGDAAQARQARRPAHLARQPPHPQPAGRPPPRPFHAAQSPAPALILPNGTNVGVPHHRRLAVRRRRRDRDALRPEIGAVVTLGKIPGRVVRHLEDGFAIEFTRLQHPDFVEENVAGAVNAALPFRRDRAGLRARIAFRRRHPQPAIRRLRLTRGARLRVRAAGAGRRHALKIQF